MPIDTFSTLVRRLGVLVSITSNNDEFSTFLKQVGPSTTFDRLQLSITSSSGCGCFNILKEIGTIKRFYSVYDVYYGLLHFIRGVTSTQFFYLSKSKSNSSQNYSSKSKSTDSKKLLK